MMNAINPPGPMTAELRYLIAKAAYDFGREHAADPDKAAYTQPRNPSELIPFEVARQVATFLVPALILGLAVLWSETWILGLLWGVPLAWFVGYRLDLSLMKARQQHFLRTNQLFGTRYEAIRFIAHYLGMSRAAVDLKFVNWIASKFPEAKAAYEAEVKPAHTKASRRAGASRGVAAAVESTSAQHAPANTYAFADEPLLAPAMDLSPLVNPATGLPMASGLYVDVGGSAYGTDINQM